MLSEKFDTVQFHADEYRAVVRGVLMRPMFNSLEAALVFAQAVFTGMRSPEPARVPSATYTKSWHNGVLVLTDLDERRRSITNDAEAVVVHELNAVGAKNAEHLRIAYRDTNGNYDGLLHDGVRFTGFKALRTCDEVVAIARLLGEVEA